ncbi:hypothetical protein FQR65_LT16684 [Abscondita terminalis]|nr:hypothetical protein FQR65_LT16684 [Abscondita terminalis]
MEHAKAENHVLQTAKEMYPPRLYAAIDRQLSEEEVKDLRRKLHGFGNTVGFTWLLQEEIKEEASLNIIIPVIEDIISSEDFTVAENKIDYFKAKCAISNEIIKETAKITTGQAQNEGWFLARKFRLTASNFGTVLACCKRNRFPPSLFNSLLGAYTLDGVKSIQWGKTHEQNGIEFLQKQLNAKIQPTGIWLTNSGLLGASPDGLLGEDSIIKIKIPQCIISYNDNGEIVVNTNHNYYHQIQGNLHILKRTQCYLYIWTLKERQFA